MIFTLVLLLMPFGTYAFFPRASQTTSRAIGLDRVTGDPTHGSSQITPGPAINNQLLLGRANFNTCGYVSGNRASPLTCPSNYDCTSTVQFQPAWACCNQVQCQGNYHTCVDYGGADICDGLGNSICSSIYTSILYCSKDAPSCFEYARSTSIGDEDIAYSLGCGQSANDVHVLVKPTDAKGSDEKADATSPGTLPGFPSETSQEDFPNTSPAPGAASTSPSSPTTSPASNKSNGISSGTLTGIVVPIVAIIVAVIVAWWRPHQVYWLLTCGCRGSRHSRRPEPIPAPIRPSPYGSQPVLMTNFAANASSGYATSTAPSTSSAGYGGGPKYNPVPQAQGLYPHQVNGQQQWQGNGYYR